jgi:hypothetical protein
MRVLMRAHMARLSIRAYALIVEAWTASTKLDQWNPESGDPLPQELRPSKRADREEIVIACAVDRETCRWVQWAIMRNHLEQITELRERPFPESERKPEGWLAEMLK